MNSEGALALTIGVVLAVAALYVVLRPILSPLPPDVRGEAEEETDVSGHAAALRALKEIEFDRAMGKLTDADYEALKQRYTEEALAVLRADEAAAPSAVPGRPSRPSAATPARLSCPTHGAQREPDAVFCSSCGRRLQPAPGFCQRCGSALEPEARFCSRCGGQVAA